MPAAEAPHASCTPSRPASRRCRGRGRADADDVRRWWRRLAVRGAQLDERVHRRGGGEHDGVGRGDAGEHPGLGDGEGHGAVGLDALDLPPLAAEALGDGARRQVRRKGRGRAVPASAPASGNTSTSPRALCSAGTRSGSTPATRSASAVAGPDRGHEHRAESPGVAQRSHEAVDRVDRGEHHPAVVLHLRRRRPQRGPAVGRVDLAGQRELEGGGAGPLESPPPGPGRARRRA